MNIWLMSVIGLLLIWIVIFALRKGLRKEMIWASIITLPLAFTEPLFVPEYWSPPSLFNLATTTGFDIESFIFTFSIGGIASVLYEFFTHKERHKKISKHKMHGKRHRFHLLVLLSPIIVFLVLYLFTNLNSIYSGIIAMFIGGFAAVLCRPDLKNKVFTGGFLFLILYFAGFLIFSFLYSGGVEQIWNLSAISGILLLGVPIEELLFALSFGMMWSSIYEHIKWYKLK